jgi:hypothetical protein
MSRLTRLALPIVIVVVGMILLSAALLLADTYEVLYADAFHTVCRGDPGWNDCEAWQEAIINTSDEENVSGAPDDLGMYLSYQYVSGNGYEPAYFWVDFGAVITATDASSVTVRYMPRATAGYYSLFHDRLPIGNSLYSSLDGVNFTWVSSDPWIDTGCSTTAGVWCDGKALSIPPGTAFRYLGFGWLPPWYGYSVNADGRVDAVTLLNVEGPPGLGPPTCDTVNDAGFDDPSAWTLENEASISNSILSLATGDYAYQYFLAQAASYTVTVTASHTDTNDSLVVSLLNADQQVVGSTVISVPADGDFHDVDALIPTEYSGAGYLMIASNQGDFEIDWICLTPGYGYNTCESESRSFDFEDGYNVGDPNWDPLSYGFSQGWRGIEYPINDFYPGNTIWQRMYLILTQGHFENAGTLIRRVGATIKYNYLVVPETITVTAYNNAPFGSEVIQILTSDDGSHWTVAGEADVSGTTDVATFTLTSAIPVYIAVADLSDMGIPVPFNLAKIDEIEMDACYGGPNQFSECLVGDPDFDIADGSPSTFYWRGNYNEAAGAATMQEGGNIYQDLTPPSAGLYNVELTVSSASSPCTVDVRFTNYGSTVNIARQTLQCNNTSQQVYDVLFTLPGNPITVWIDQIAGDSSISRVCITLASGPGECLNYNPDMVGISGYTGDWYDAGGKVAISPDGKLAATGVEYQRAEPPYQLDVTISPAISATSANLTINHGNVPPTTVDDVYTITETSNLTYVLASEISGNFGPTLWNDGDGALSVLRYCIHPITETVVVTDPFWCATVQNPDFIDGLERWDSDNVMAFNGIASFADAGYVAQDLGSLVTDTTNATVRWLADGYQSTVATLTVASDAGVFSSSHTINAGNPRFYEDTGSISGTTSITVSAVNSGLELDFVCLYPGDTAPELPPDEDGDGVEIPPGGSLAECIAPPMGILPNITSTLSSLWPWGGTMTNFEVLMAYNTGWVRFIGCRLDYFVTWMDEVFWGEPWRLGLGGDGLRAHLDQIIFLLAALNVLALIQALLALLQAIGLAVDSILDGIAEAARVILYIIGLVGIAILALLGLIMLLVAIITLLWQVPQEFWISFRGAATGSDAVALPLPTSEADPLYNIIVGIQVVNQVAGQTILFPIVVIAVTIGSFAILIWTIKQFGIKIT